MNPCCAWQFADVGLLEPAGGVQGRGEAKGGNRWLWRRRDVNLEETRHQGQVALRRLYHESKRPLVVMYTSPGCGASIVHHVL